ncbi:hypothetical protein AGMMS49521_0770 [Campylobacterota bacterium]|nr:hypothetical protein AGMMS49521_0770 [Campylobacterota bacterium]
MFKQLAKRTFQYYGDEIFAFYDALAAYPIEGKTVIVWGLAGCNCEAIALFYKAAKVFVVDYNKPVCEHPNIEVLSHEELKNSGIVADVAFSYSSFEHDGLGRYGDPISPSGDLRAMGEAREFLADGGMLFLGVPMGQDCLVWNAHRIYGKIRLPMLLKGFRAEDVFDVYGTQSGEYPFDLPLGAHRQSVLVCRKIGADYPTDLAAKTGAQGGGKTHRPDILARINRAVLEHKQNAAR